MNLVTLGLGSPAHALLTLGLYSEPVAAEELVTLGLGFEIPYLIRLGLG